MCDVIYKKVVYLGTHSVILSRFYTFEIVFMVKIAQELTKLFFIDAHEREIQYAASVQGPRYLSLKKHIFEDDVTYVVK